MNFYELWNNDFIYKLVPEIHYDLILSDEKPKIIFFHCTHGKDRTGIVFGGNSTILCLILFIIIIYTDMCPIN